MTDRDTIVANGRGHEMRRTTMAGTILTAALALGLLVGPTAGSAPREDPRAERERIRIEQAELARTIDTTQASVDEVDAALAALDEQLAAEESALAAAEADVAAAEADIAEAEGSIERFEDEVAALQDAVRERAVAAYVSPPGDDVLTVLESEDFTSASARRFYVELRASSDADVADRLDGALADLDDAREAASAAKEAAETARSEQAERTEGVRQAAADKQAVADRLEASIQANVDRSVELAKTDRELAGQIAAEQALLAARLADERAKQIESERRAQGERAPDSAQAPDGSEDRPLAPNPPSSPSPPSGGGSGGGGGGGICLVGAIDISCSIAGNLRNMLDAAAADGVVMSGGGYRDPAEQIALRRQNCGTSSYAIYQMPPGSCSPPTAKPGTSQHELGLAVDVSYNGSTLCFKRATCAPGTNPAYDWLMDNAATYGFYKLRSEAWHWSSTGR